MNTHDNLHSLIQFINANNLIKSHVKVCVNRKTIKIQFLTLYSMQVDNVYYCCLHATYQQRLINETMTNTTTTITTFL